MQRMSAALPESPYAWLRLAASLALMTLGGVAMYGVVVVLPAVQAEFGVARADAALPYTLTMIGFGIGGVLMGALADRYGVIVPVVIGALGLGSGLILAGMSTSILQFALALAEGIKQRGRSSGDAFGRCARGFFGHTTSFHGAAHDVAVSWFGIGSLDRGTHW